MIHFIKNGQNDEYKKAVKEERQLKKEYLERCFFTNVQHENDRT